MRNMMAMAKEWATELGKFSGHEHIVADETMKGFEEVEKGRNPDIVLKEVLAKIAERIDANYKNLPVQ